ncbi:bifunctional (p)ppGpp synthetase/guanosine-3',5'-bis(diphosphate) 3'-pyrophosphohydrolase [Neglecta sp. X4]|uniref:RelA/SpoT family protein n=1 Tax=unclassified Neglectibacter TaxID=2632164 RepID=UPI0013689A37|nr:MULTISPECIES: bifunctional (p)ppGpp synthetase/guanosine-3',5'-bis(diphosphate) 3'-pyrophosphohydrolase [unclassified Neglectibacter]NBI17750.1 bifunctional (p)ppGpp synthetase/guanosine-3',5'-bis(diphosphate) 3'-pyrophosphohydrolase [Neglectibacter sp. 59]NBJ73346.1 bifunctional (p)ppGpp synthetase/guanosine-3',5'-bis(diphosphate) 3'-pyrophosphohydrolase [Neglectibacter sp. X4]NCE81200.1 bifunctional (p)ppGpp synthetase/guanosine-3',5'-bis(diphosphate) 3'-pyrophosphohydrolase [Neglectibacter
MADIIQISSYEELQKIIGESGKDYDRERIGEAYWLAEEKHRDQRRSSGEPYIIHPLSVAAILVELGMDSQSVMAGLLHDVVEDTDCTIEDITAQFGHEVALLIDGVTKLDKIPYSSREEQQAENLRKMLMAMAEDIRVIIIKFADRMHNLSTLEYVSPQKQRDKARECLEVYAPIAHRLGMRTVKECMEDISLKYLDPSAYHEVLENLSSRSKSRDEFIASMKKQIKERIGQAVPNVYIEGRVKSIYSIYRKMFIQGKIFEEIYDVFALRVIVDTIEDCYNVLGIVHDTFQPLPNRFKDYISLPKPNMYQSLHTTVINKAGVPFEVQIRTWEMHYTAEYGIAAHWKYKLGMSAKASDNRSMDDRLSWIRQMLENQAESEDITDLVHSIKSDLVPEEVFVFTPKGDVRNLPMGSTVIDFAYAIHSAVGNRMIGAKVDKRIVPLDYKVKTGEIIEILTTKEVGKGPNRDWLTLVRTSEARNKIRAWFKKEKREENIIEGKAELEREFRRSGMAFSPELMAYMVESVGKRHNCSNEEDFYAAIGYGGIQLWKVLPRIKEEYQRLHKASAPEDPSHLPPPAVPRKQKVANGVLVEGMDNCLVKLSRCCNPLPGDDIVGFITRGFGVSIHKRGCSNVPQDLTQCPEPERWVNAYWEGDVKDDFKSTLHIVAEDRAGLLADVTMQLSNMKIFIHSLNSRQEKGGINAVISATISINGLPQLQNIIDRLSKIKGVLSIDRT